MLTITLPKPKTVVFLLGSVLSIACSTNNGGGFKSDDITGPGLDTNGDGKVDGNDQSGNGQSVDIEGAPPPGCGDGNLTKDEACDDHNKEAGDGCAANCLSVEAGFSCNPVGVPCHRVARCGDSVVVPPELCDDGNKDPGDGCSASCKYEPGYKCDGSPSTCTPTTCGDGVIEGAESCEDGNAKPFDGCSSLCQNEPDCKSGACQSECGDGIVVGEDCDDGNNTDGDGCSADCKVEGGYECKSSLGNTMRVPAVYRDFQSAHPDFEPGASGQDVGTSGLVKEELDADGKPVFAAANNTKWITSADTFAEWYRDVPGTNSTTTGFITLYSKGDGSYVNRYGANGEQWQKTKILYYCGSPTNARTDADGNPIPCSDKYDQDGQTDCEAAGDKLLSCYIDPKDTSSYKGVVLTELVDGNPLYFPVDKDSFSPETERSEASLASPMYTEFGWPKESEVTSVVVKHNFSFTSEVRYWFKYDASKSYTLDFTGDDDVWVFINKHLAVDTIGGIHTPVNGSVVLDATAAATYGLEDGNVYEVELFQAERQTNASTFKLTLSGFSAAPSDCRPICGDGIVGIGEECDDGKNDGGYGECSPGCVLGEFCGDGIIQPGEDCDDGNAVDGDKCGSACRDLVIIQ
jgi:fibro-slime domain-containing protein